MFIHQTPPASAPSRRPRACAWRALLLVALLLPLGCSDRQPNARHEPARSTADRAGNRPEIPASNRSDSGAGTKTQPAAVEREANVQQDSGPVAGVLRSAQSTVAHGRASPAVILSQQHARSCRVFVGDSFPRLSVLDRQGQPVSLDFSRSEHPTVVIFWNAENGPAAECVRRVPRELERRLGTSAMRLVTIHVGRTTSPSESEFDPTVEPYEDPEGRAFLAVATRWLPRTYLLDSRGRIVWFDLEYSRGMQRDLVRALDGAR